ncbi:DHS-like NAD/FAD-binding domain-containing protein [Coprinopsis marcescibilis]|uniref:DHS-like NAD/FAD-binding domain-containing protein n=1 Tax=Coprinopsis marcescibilis TaxID=230819 RepID=A0A5C3L667_COPMA|nr:DHS-like NAD/FAD-binding domain-containing protein [Coprinopsis marcescibilis]
MTIFLPLEEDAPLPQSPAFLQQRDRNALERVTSAIMKAKRIVIVCGAGISVQAGIPDFRSQDGLFKTIKRDNPKEALSSGKDLFDASVFNSEQRTALFCQMMAQLADLSQNASPTSFHHLLRALNDRGRLLRVYTQNIDALEEKCGLSFGVPEFEGKKWRGRPKGRSLINASDHSNTADEGVAESSSSRLATPSTETPRCIPLHGTLQMMHCQICNHSFPLHDYLSSLNAGQPPQCPECTHLEKTRALVGKRPRGVGRLRPSVVLYNEAHHNGESVGDVVQKDLIGSSKGRGKSGADLLLVVGTSLKVPGTKRMVREFAKAVKSRGVGSYSKEESSTGSNSPAGSSRQSPSSDDEPSPPPVKAIYLNLDFPVPTREWEGVFDAWVQGDAQTFADMLREEIKKEAKIKELALERKRRREEEAALAAAASSCQDTEMVDVEIQPLERPLLPTPQSTPKRKNGHKHKTVAVEAEIADVEMQSVEGSYLPTPQATPKRKSGHKSEDHQVVTPPKRQKTTASSSKTISASQTSPIVTANQETPKTPRRSFTSCAQHDDDESAIVGSTSEPSPTPPYLHRRPSSNTIDEYSSVDGTLISNSLRRRLSEIFSQPSRLTPYNPCIVVTSSMRSTLQDHERECGLFSPLIHIGHDGYRGDG